MIAASGRAALALLTFASLARAQPAAVTAAEASTPPGEARSSPAPTPPIATVLYPLRALGIAPDAAASLEASLRNEVSALPEVAVIAPQVLAASLERERDSDCLARLACAASAAVHAGARQFVSGTVSGLGDAVLVDLKLVDARTGEELRRITHPISGNPDLLIELLHAAAIELLAPARFVGRLSVKLLQSVAQAAGDDVGTRVYVDGKLVATMPLSHPIDGLVPGQHALRVAREGYHDASLFVEIRFDRTAEALVDLPRGALAGVAYLRAEQPAAAAASSAPPAAPSPPGLAVSSAPPASEPRGPWMKIGGWSALGLGAVCAVAGVATHLKAYQTANQLDSAFANKMLTASDNPLYTDVNTEVGAARFLYVLTALFGGGGAALLLYDHHLDQPRAVAQPLLFPEGGGVALSGAF